MNRIKTIVLIAVFLLLSGCAKAEAQKAEPEPENVSMFVAIEKSPYWHVVADVKDWACGMNRNVLAWQPMPEPWKGEA